MKEILSVVPGRVTARSAHTATIEFPSQERPSPGAALRHPGGWLEVLRATNPTEVLASARAGASPAVGSRVSWEPQGLRLPPLPQWRNATLGPLGQSDLDPQAQAEPQASLALPSDADLSAPAEADLGEGSHGEVLLTGVAGLDLLAPLLRGGSLALQAEAHTQGRPLLQQITARVAREHGLYVLLLTSAQDPSWAAALEGLAWSQICAPGSLGRGGQALATRSLLALAQALRQQGHALLVVLDKPGPLINAWRQEQPDGLAASARAAARFSTLVQSLARPQAPGATLLALLQEDPTAPPLPGAGGDLPARDFLASAYLRDDSSLDLSRLLGASRAQPGVSPEHRALALRAQEALQRQDTDDHAMIFGLEELDPEQAEALEAAQRLEALLQRPQGEHKSLSELYEVVEGALEISAGS